MIILTAPWNLRYICSTLVCKGSPLVIGAIVHAPNIVPLWSKLSSGKDISLWKRIGELTEEVEDHSQHALGSVVQLSCRAVYSLDPAERNLRLAV